MKNQLFTAMMVMVALLFMATGASGQGCSGSYQWDPYFRPAGSDQQACIPGLAPVSSATQANREEMLSAGASGEQAPEEMTPAGASREQVPEEMAPQAQQVGSGHEIDAMGPEYNTTPSLDSAAAGGADTPEFAPAVPRHGIDVMGPEYNAEPSLDSAVPGVQVEKGEMAPAATHHGIDVMGPDYTR